MTTESRILFLETNEAVTISSSRGSGSGGTPTEVQHQWSSPYQPIRNGGTAVRQVLGGICTLLRLSTFRGRARVVPGRGFVCPPLAELGLFGRRVAEDTEG